MVLPCCRRLAPIRGVPTKGGGLESTDNDLKEIFSSLENIPQAPGKVRHWMSKLPLLTLVWTWQACLQA